MRIIPFSSEPAGYVSPLDFDRNATSIHIQRTNLDLLSRMVSRIGRGGVHGGKSGHLLGVEWEGYED